jgi:hypothetical protein
LPARIEKRNNIPVPAVDVMRKLLDDKGDFGEEAAEFVKNRYLY